MTKKEFVRELARVLREADRQTRGPLTLGYPTKEEQAAGRFALLSVRVDLLGVIRKFCPDMETERFLSACTSLR